MQFNHRVDIQYVTTFTDYGEPVASTSASLRCCILSETVAAVSEAKRRKNKYDLQILVNAKAYTPYSRLFEDALITITRSGRTYEVANTSLLNSFGGKPRYYLINFMQVHR